MIKGIIERIMVSQVVKPLLFSFIIAVQITFGQHSVKTFPSIGSHYAVDFCSHDSGGFFLSSFVDSITYDDLNFNSKNGSGFIVSEYNHDYSIISKDFFTASTGLDHIDIDCDKYGYSTVLNSQGDLFYNDSLIHKSINQSGVKIVKQKDTINIDFKFDSDHSIGISNYQYDVIHDLEIIGVSFFDSLRLNGELLVIDSGYNQGVLTFDKGAFNKYYKFKSSGFISIADVKISNKEFFIGVNISKGLEFGHLKYGVNSQVKLVVFKIADDSISEVNKSINDMDEKLIKFVVEDDQLYIGGIESKGVNGFDYFIRKVRNEKVVSTVNFGGWDFDRIMDMKFYDSILVVVGQFKPSASFYRVMHNEDINSFLHIYDENLQLVDSIHTKGDGGHVLKAIQIQNEDIICFGEYLNELKLFGSDLMSDASTWDLFTLSLNINMPINHIFNYSNVQNTSLWPVPVNDLLNINSKRVIRQVNLWDLKGKILNRFMNENGFDLSVFLGDIKNGVYTLELIFEKRREMHRIVIER